MNPAIKDNWAGKNDEQLDKLLEIITSLKNKGYVYIQIFAHFADALIEADIEIDIATFDAKLMKIDARRLYPQKMLR